MKIKNIIFDVGGVLASPKSGNWFITNNFYNIVDKNLIDEGKLKQSLKSNLYLHTQNPKTEKEEHEMFSNYYYKVLSDINYPNISRELSDKLADDCVYNDEKFAFYDDVDKNLKLLSQKYNLYIISNGWPSSLRVLHNKGVDKYFKGIMISSMYTDSKEKTLFKVFLDKYKINPRESIYIDDRKHILQRARMYKFGLLLMNRKNNKKAILFKTIYSLKEIK